MDFDELDQPTTDEPNQDASWNNEDDMYADESMAQGYDDLNRRRSKNNAIALLAICVATAVGLYFYAGSHRPKEPTAEEIAQDAKLDLALAKLLPNTKPDQQRSAAEATDMLVAAFYEYPGKQQVPLDKLRRSPFRLVFAASPTDDQLALTKSPEYIAQQQQLEAEQRALQTALNALKLQSILIGPSQAKCIINGEVIGVGEDVEGFTVQTIQDRTVTLVAQDQEYQLQM